MAFSYSDENFTVIGNLCFVHILLDGTERFIDIPPAIVDRILIGDYFYLYPYFSNKEARSAGGSVTRGIGYAKITGGKISLSNVGTGYLSFYFPIDSNK